MADFFNRIKNRKQENSSAKKFDGLFDNVDIRIADWTNVIEAYGNGNFVMAFYPVNRKTDVIEHYRSWDVYPKLTSVCMKQREKKA